MELQTKSCGLPCKGVCTPVSVVPAPIFVLMQGCKQVASVEACGCGHRKCDDAPCPGEIGESVGEGQDPHTHHSCHCVECCIPPPALRCWRACGRKRVLRLHITVPHMLGAPGVWSPWERNNASVATSVQPWPWLPPFEIKELLVIHFVKVL